ncbi:MAG: hypothetical protein AAFW82_10530 [Pseudomonadota bacterium]
MGDAVEIDRRDAAAAIFAREEVLPRDADLAVPGLRSVAVPLRSEFAAVLFCADVLLTLATFAAAAAGLFDALSTLQSETSKLFLVFALVR